MARILTGRFVWFEYSSKDARKAQAFYGELFGWGKKDIQAPSSLYTMITSGDDGIGGYWPPPPDGAPQNAQWIPHLQVESAAGSADKVKALGGDVKMQPMKVGDYGTFAVVTDPGGAVFSLWQPDQMKSNADYLGRPGCWVWNELMTDDTAKAIAFYKELGGFEEDRMEGIGGPYHLLKSDGVGRAGIMKSPKPGTPSAWVPYIQVASADESAARAKTLGATIHVPPTDIPDVGRFSVLLDNQAATIAILQPSPRSH